MKDEITLTPKKLGMSGCGPYRVKIITEKKKMKKNNGIAFYFFIYFCL